MEEGGGEQKLGREGRVQEKVEREEKSVIGNRGRWDKGRGGQGNRGVREMGIEDGGIREEGDKRKGG